MRGFDRLSASLYIISTPVGNLGDLSKRAAEALQSADLILAEDTRVTEKILRHLGLHKRLVSCHDYNERSRLALLDEVCQAGLTVALVSDAGTPLVSDPGFQILRKAIDLGLAVIPIPGPSAFLIALVGSGLSCDRFTFEGFLPGRKGERLKRLAALSSEERTMVFYLAPHDAATLLAEMSAVFGNRAACLARELTKLYEEFVRGDLTSILSRVKAERLRGECVLVVAGAAPEKKSAETEVRDDLHQLLAGGARLKEAAAVVAKRHGWASAAVYRLGLSMKEQSSGS